MLCLYTQIEEIDQSLKQQATKTQPREIDNLNSSKIILKIEFKNKNLLKMKSLSSISFTRDF